MEAAVRIVPWEASAPTVITAGGGTGTAAGLIGSTFGAGGSGAFENSNRLREPPPIGTARNPASKSCRMRIDLAHVQIVFDLERRMKILDVARIAAGEPRPPNRCCPKHAVAAAGSPGLPFLEKPTSSGTCPGTE